MSDIVLYLCKAMRGEFHLLFFVPSLVLLHRDSHPDKFPVPGNFLSKDVILAVSP